MNPHEGARLPAPVTVDEEQSIGVSFPPTHLSESACAVMIGTSESLLTCGDPHFRPCRRDKRNGMPQAWINYLMSVKAVDKAGNILPSAASALFLDDNPWTPLRERHISEWDSSCCLIALRNGTVVKIPESPLILPSVTNSRCCYAPSTERGKC